MFRKIKDISGEKLYEHLTKMGIHAEVIPKGSPDDLVPSGSATVYSFSIKLKGLNIDVIQISRYRSRYNLWFNPIPRAHQYWISYIVKSSRSKMQNLEGKLEEEEKRTLEKEWVTFDWQNHCVKIWGTKADFVSYHEEIKDQKEKVNYVFLKDIWFPSLKTIESNDKKAWQVRRMLESGRFLWEQPVWPEKYHA